jgi:hypothetical protein
MNSSLDPALLIRWISSDVSKDLTQLPTQNLFNLAMNAIQKLSRGEVRGTRLRIHSEIGDLSQCFKLYFDESRDVSPRYRIVFKYIPNPARPLILMIIAVGKRENYEVYLAAVLRLKESSPG